VRRLPVGDGIWIARHKQLGSEYVLDFIVERKNVDDLRSSIRDNRYREQKVRILRSGLKRLIYLVEGDPNACESAESIKTACMTTEILEGFDVPQVTEEVAIAVLDLYPTVISLARAYSHLDGDTCGQEELLKKQSNDVISGSQVSILRPYDTDNEKEESTPVYDTDIEDVIEEEE
nr:crossover junction endonuclease MUS81 [Tanacetum cinerariifolium]